MVDDNLGRIKENIYLENIEYYFILNFLFSFFAGGLHIYSRFRRQQNEKSECKMRRLGHAGGH